MRCYFQGTQSAPNEGKLRAKWHSWIGIVTLSSAVYSSNIVCFGLSCLFSKVTGFINSHIMKHITALLDSSWKICPILILL